MRNPPFTPRQLNANIQTKMETRNESVIIIGGGLVGSLAAIFMSKRGYNVQLYEKRKDYRKFNLGEGRSINLALSNRGRRALNEIGIEEEILAKAVPMNGRFIHYNTGETKSILYDRLTNQCLYSIGRNDLNLLLIQALKKYKNCTMYFEHTFVSANLKKGEVTFLNTSSNETTTKTADLILAADGAFSAVRQSIQKTSLLTFSQTYIEHGYIELTVKSELGAKMKRQHLHIWPRNTFMMIALPNSDDSWTVTLFMPFENFEKLTTPEELMVFFAATFPDFLNYVDEKDLIADFFEKSPMPLVSVKCSPYNHDRVLLIGDAAHAMVPFYGQGMNAGFEDCHLLDSLLNEYDGDIPKCLDEFTRRRKDDAHSICDLAMYNYVEMRHLVTTFAYTARKTFDEWMFWWLPNIWTPLYNSVTFSKMGYKDCVLNREWQNMVIKLFGTIASAVIFVVITALIYFLTI